MIPQKLYIPTTTLNFNNIMASESISPTGFYSMRGFGYKRFDKVAPNCLDKRILLYDKYPNFTVDDEELESYPLVVEVSSNDINEDVIKEYKDGVFYSEETIYLNPFSTKIYFRNKEERRRTLSKVEQSLNTKMVSIYQNSILDKPSEIASFDWKNIDIVDSHDDFAKYISKDRKINKLKGFLYAYLLGANRSLSPEVVELKKYAKELRNTISAILTNPDGYANYKQKEELDILYQKINDAFHCADGTNAMIQNLLKHKSEEYNCPNFIDILRKENLYDTWFQSQGFKPSYRVRPFNLSFPHKNYTKKKDNGHNSNGAEENQKYFDGYFAELDNAIRRYIKSTNTNISDLPVLQYCNIVSSIPADKSGFQSKLFNEYAEEYWNGEELLNSRLDFATAGGKLFKEELGNSWENSPSKSYINDLRKNLVSHTPFALNSVNNLTLQSFAVFCQKGEEDIDKLEDYLISNDIADFRIAFSLWGLIFGFANMPKTLTNDLFLSGDDKYKSEVYKYIFKQVHGLDIEGELEDGKEYKAVVPSQSNGFTEVKEPELIITDDKIHNKIPVLELENKLRPCKLKSEQSDSIKDAYEKNGNQASKLFFDSIKKIRGIGDKKLQQIKDALGYAENDVEPKKTKAQSQSAPALPLFQSTGFFLTDFDFLSSNNEFVDIVSRLNNDWEKDLKWFIDSHDMSHKDYEKYWKGKPKDNDSVIKQFIFLKKEIYKSSESVLRKLYLTNDK